MKRRIMTVLLFATLFLFTGCSNEPEGLKFAINDEGACIGLGNVTWDMSKEQVAVETGGKEDITGCIVIEDSAFAGCTGNLKYSFLDEELNGAVFTVSKGETYNNYSLLLEELTETFGEPHSGKSLDEARDNNEYNAAGSWNNRIYTPDGKKMQILLEMVPLTKNVRMFVFLVS